jgi:pimeloyl-ACP methyl ester carboxylesterase
VDVQAWIETARDGAEPSRAAVEDTVDMLFATRTDTATRETYIQAVRRADPAYLAAVLGAARRLDLSSQLAAITAPTLVIRGSADRARSAAHSAALAAAIPTVRSVEMHGAGHSPMVDRSDEFARLVSTHLDEEITADGAGR